MLHFLYRVQYKNEIVFASVTPVFGMTLFCLVWTILLDYYYPNSAEIDGGLITKCNVWYSS